MRSNPHRFAQGSALIIALIMVVMLSILLIGFSTRARLEQATATAHSDAAEAGSFAEMGLGVAAAKIASATESGRFWASAPGRIFTMPRAPAGWGTPSVIELSSGMSADASNSANLNPPSLLHSGGVIHRDETLPMRLRWIYVRKDGSQELGDSVPAYNANNPLAGRYAFWVDDNSSRINLNTAAARNGNPAAPGHPSQVDLRALTDTTSAEVEKLKEFRSTKHLLNSVGEATKADPALESWISQASLSFTNFNHSTERNVFDEPRILLTTKASLANGQEFFDVTTIADADPGLFANLSPDKVAALFTRLYELLDRTDRPFMEGKSFVQKYGENQAAQMVIDLIDYVRAADSPIVAVEPIRGTFSPATKSFTLNAGAIDFMANGRKPYITQIAVRVDKISSTGWKFDYAIEVFLPRWEGGGALDLTDLRLYIGLWGGGTKQVDIAESMLQGGRMLQAGGYGTILYSFTVYGQTGPPNPMPIHIALFSKTTTQRFDIVALGNDRIMYKYEDPPPVSVFKAQSVAVDDPFVNKRRESWIVGPSDFGRAANVPSRASTIGAVAGGTPAQDADVYGNIASAGIRVPAPGAGVQSIGEIGAIHTGGKGIPETPWRTIRLQPSPSDLPDWLLLDDFAAPWKSSEEGREKAVLRPHESTKGGTMNLNARLHPFDGGSNEIERSLPLRALLLNAREGGGVVDANRAETLAKSILAQTPATTPYSGRFFLPEISGIEGFYLFPGQMAEISEVAARGEESEVLVSEIVPLLTTRSNVFSVYAIGQSLRQQSDGTVRVLGERYTLTVLERAEHLRIISQKEVEP